MFHECAHEYNQRHHHQSTDVAQSESQPRTYRREILLSVQLGKTLALLKSLLLLAEPFLMSGGIVATKRSFRD